MFHLHASPKVIEERLKNKDREGHFMNNSLLMSQVRTLETPLEEEGITSVDVNLSVQEICDKILSDSVILEYTKHKKNDL